MASHRSIPLKISSNSNYFGRSGRPTDAPKPQSRPPRMAGFEVKSPAAPTNQGLRAAGVPHGLGQWSPSPSVARELLARRRSGPGRLSHGHAERNASTAPLRIGGLAAPHHKRVRLLDEPQELPPAAPPRGLAAAAREEPAQRPPCGKLVISFPAGVASSRLLSARRPQHGKKSRASGAAPKLTERTATGLLMLQWKPDSAESGSSPALSAPETPGPSPDVAARVSDYSECAQGPHMTTAAADAPAVALPTPPPPQPAAPTPPSSLVGQMNPTSVLPQPSVPLQAVLVERDASSPTDKFYHPTATAQCAVLPPADDPVEARRQKRAGVSTAPRTVPVLSVGTTRSKPSRSKGGKHASVCPGPWASALDNMPEAIPGVNKRVKNGTSHVRVSHADHSAVEKNRAARALVAILPYSTAKFILRDPDHVVAARPAADTAERLVEAIEAFGLGSINNAYSAYGSLVSWVATHMPETTEIHGSVVSDYMKAAPPSQTALDSLSWLADRCGVDLPTRAPVCRRFKRPPASTEHDKESVSFAVLLGLCALALDHPSPHVRGQAAGFYALAKLALRFEQSRACAVNSFVARSCGGVLRTFISISLLSDKHPDPSKMRPRPRWAVIDDLHLNKEEVTTDAVRLALVNMLTGAEDVKCLILETDSKTGDPSSASKWVMSPLEEPSRVDASIHGLMKLIGAPPEAYMVIHGHSFKR